MKWVILFMLLVKIATLPFSIEKATQRVIGFMGTTCRNHGVESNILKTRSRLVDYGLL